MEWSVEMGDYYLGLRFGASSPPFLVFPLQFGISLVNFFFFERERDSGRERERSAERMGRPPQSGGPAFRFTQNEVVEMEACLQEGNNAIPPREVMNSLAEKFSSSAERVGKVAVQPKQVWNWFQNRRHQHRAKALGKAVGRTIAPPIPIPMGAQFQPEESISFASSSQHVAASASGVIGGSQMEFEAKSARDGAWYDVSAFLSHRSFDTGDPEVRVRFSGFGMEEDEWVNVAKCVRQRSLPCESAECVAVLPGDLILCFQEGKEQALYFDAHVLDAQRRRHDVRGCRCRFLVRYDHDGAEEIVPLRKVCRRPETDYRLQILQASRLGRPIDHVQTQDPLHKMTTARSAEEIKAGSGASATILPKVNPSTDATTPEKSNSTILDAMSEDAAASS
ncbi:hypothetical protein LUZ62_051239 [Rhynchospora pubera]|uniref:Homeobox domain-containing protein n=1 Tax=Rhynchospora pubera TaxID=906938 RepID=A0AAV8G2Z2_9POAL|nr:hypothetical protein LUZ62_051239 [Rhynchospora pubera]